MIQGVAGVILWTEDLERLSTFYQETLGLKPHSMRPDFVAFSFGDVRLSLGTHSEVAGLNRDPYRIMVNLAVDDIHAVARNLTERGVVFLRNPEQEGWEVGSLHSGSDGNVLQLLQQPITRSDNG
jgi:predicted enzyme related to lactoylglutathione lyase